MVGLLLFHFSVSAAAQQERVDLDLREVSMERLFREIQQQTGLFFVYNEELTSGVGPVTVRAERETVESVLRRVLEGTGLTFGVEGETIVIREGTREEEPVGRKVTGVVKDEGGMVLPGVSVLIKGTAIGVATDVDGRFELEVTTDTVTLVFSFVGMRTREVTVRAEEAMKPLTVVMEEEAVMEDEVVVVGYGTTRARDLTGQVASLGEEQLERKTVTNVETMLQNAAAGVVVSLSSANPAEKIRVRVRGESSLTGENEPLYVVDGIPVSSDVLNTIAPGDIASMDVLKDASAAAIYGSRGANGVVIITTKRGTTGRPVFDVSYTWNTDVRRKRVDVLDGNESRAFVRKVAEETLKVNPSSTAAKEILEEGSTYLADGNTDWYEELYKPAQRHDVNVSLRGGDERSTYYISLGVMRYTGMIDHESYTRYNGRINLDYKVTDFLRFGTSTTLGYTDISNAGTSLYTAVGFRPDYPIYNEDGSYFTTETGSNNPVASNEARSFNDNYSILSTSYLELDVWKGLKLRTQLALNQMMAYGEGYTPTYLTYYGNGSGYETHSRQFGTVWDNTLSYKGTFGDVHALDAVAGVSFERTRQRSSSLYMETYPMDEILTGIGNASEYSSNSGSGTEWGLFSSFVRVNYRLMDRYLLTFTARYDGSSAFGSNNRYGFFPSGAIAWRLSDEPFMQGTRNVVDDLKVKFSVGKTGVQNFDLGSHANKDLYETSSYLDEPAIEHSQLGNKDLRWETTVQYDLGVDFSLWNSMLSGSVAWYRKNTEDLIWDYTPPSSLAVAAVPRNVGSVRNQGIEVSLRANDLLRKTKDWSWELGLNLSHNSNKVTHLEEEGAIANGMGVTVQGSGNQVLVEGKAMGVFFGYAFDGIIQDQETIDELNAKADAAGKATYEGSNLRPGHLLIRDVDGSGYIDNYDRVVIGSPEADVTGGLTSTVTWKRLSLYTHFGFQIGGEKLYNKSLQNLPNQLTGLMDYNLDNRWSPSNPDAELPAMYIGDGVYKTTKLFLHNASNLRLQELRLSWELPETWGGKWLKSGMVFFAANNLFVITDYPGLDPSTVGSAMSNYGANYEAWGYPSSMTFSFGLKLNF